MTTALKKVRSGDSLVIPAETFNAFVDTALAFKRQQRGVAREPQREQRQTGIILVRNESGADRARFDVLGITDRAPQEVIKAIYRAWMKTLKVHPDLGGDVELCKRINLAYETLKDPARRAAYDSELAQRVGATRSESKRRAPRTSVSASIGITSTSECGWIAAETIDASVLGLRFRAAKPLEIGAHIAVAFSGSAAASVEATVKWGRAFLSERGMSYEFGVEFFDPVPDIINRLGSSDGAKMPL